MLLRFIESRFVRAMFFGSGYVKMCACALVTRITHLFRQKHQPAPCSIHRNASVTIGKCSWCAVQRNKTNVQLEQIKRDPEITMMFQRATRKKKTKQAHFEKTYRMEQVTLCG